MSFLTVAIVFALGTAFVFGFAALLLKGLDRLHAARPDHCSFCDKHTRDVGALVPAPGLNVCRACIQIIEDTTSDNMTDAQAGPSQNTESAAQLARCRVCGRSVPVHGALPFADRSLLCRECLAIVRKTADLLSGSFDA